MFSFPHSSEPVAYGSVPLRVDSNGLVKLVVNLHDNDRSSTLVVRSKLGSDIRAKRVRGFLRIRKIRLDERRGRFTEESGVELHLVSGDVVQKAEDVWLEVDDGGGDVEALVFVQRLGGVGNAGGVVDRLGEVGGLELDLQGGDGVVVLEGVEGCVEGGDVAVDVADGLVDGDIVALDYWRGQSKEWEEGKSGEHLDCWKDFGLEEAAVVDGVSGG